MKIKITRPKESDRYGKWGWIVAPQGVVIGRYLMEEHRVLAKLWDATWSFPIDQNWRKMIRERVHMLPD